MPNPTKLFLRGLRSDIAEQDLTEKQVGVGLRLYLADAGLQPPDHVQRLKQVLIQAISVRGDFLLHRQGNPEIRRLPYRHSQEFRRSYANNRVHS